VDDCHAACLASRLQPSERLVQPPAPVISITPTPPPIRTPIHPTNSDRFFEAGFDDDVLLSATAALPTTEFAKYAAVGLISALGVAGFAAKAYQDKMRVDNIQILTA